MKKNLLYRIINNKGIISSIFAILAFGFGLVGYVESLKAKEFMSATVNVFALFGLNFPKKEELNFWIFLASVFAMGTIFLPAILFFFKDAINKQIFLNRSNKEHIAVFGLGKISRTLLEDCIYDNVIIIEQKELYAEEYREKGFGVKVGDAFNPDFLENSLNFEKMKYAIIAFGDDKLNIEFAKKIITQYRKQNIKTPIKLIVHINNRNFSRLFGKNVILGNANGMINIKTFSYYEECARDLFSKHDIDGDTLEYMNSSKPLDTVLSGDNELIKNIVYKIVSLSHFPNKNKHTLHIVHKDASKLLKELKEYINYGEDNGREKFPTIELNAIDLDYKTLEFYTHNIWQKENVENIIVCYDDESINIDLGTTLHDRVYLADTIDNKKVPKIIMAVYDELDFSHSINANRCEYKNMFIFGNQKDIVNKEHLLNETIDNISKLIHKGYGDEYNPEYLERDKEALDKKWFDSARFSDKLSNISQARHLDIKLKALGLRKILCNENEQELLEHNREMLNSILENERNISDEDLKKYSKEITKFYKGQEFKVDFWEKLKEDNLFNKLLNMEHDRWIAYHYLEGWKYSKIKNKDKKEHNCLIPLNEFNEKELQITAIYDMYSFLYIPNYLAQTGYKIVPYVAKLGVTGHRDISEKTKKKIKEEIKKLKCYGITHIISPLANGADRVVAKYAMSEFDAELIAPVPFELKEYKKSFKDSIKEFEDILGCIKPKELDKLNKDKNELYQKCGEYVVDNCDILIAVWDGKKARGVGGTANIVRYAKEKKKKIIYINSETQKVKEYYIK